MDGKEKKPVIRIVSLDKPVYVEKPLSRYPSKSYKPLTCLTKYLNICNLDFPLKICTADFPLIYPDLPCYTKKTYGYCSCDKDCSCDCVDCKCDCDHCRCDCDHCRCDCDHCRCDCDFCTCDSKGGYSPYKNMPPHGCEIHHRTIFKISKE